jgi:DNA helicase HerA-like ATPase
MRAKPGLDIEAAITELGVGEALVSFLDAKGRPSITERVFVLPPGSQIGPITPQQREALIANSLVAGAYEKAIDRESAYEKLKGRSASAQDDSPIASQAGSRQSAPPDAPAADDGGGLMGGLGDILFGSTGPRGGRNEGLAQSMARSAVRTMGTTVGREIIRGVLGSLLGGGSRRR